MKENWNEMEEMLTPELLNNLQFIPEAAEDFLQTWALMFQVSVFTPFWIVVTQNDTASLFQKYYVMAGLAFSETEKQTLTWDRKKLNELSYLQMH